jgi:hypothetical protein
VEVRKRFWLWSLFIGVVIALFVLGYTPQLARYTRQGAVNADSYLFHGWYAEDYRVYLSAIVLGQNGYTLFRNPFTNENLPPLPYYTYYIAFGWITGPFGVAPYYVYHLAKTVAILVFIIASYGLARVFFSSKTPAIVATILGLIVTTVPNLFYNQQIASSFTSWWVDWLQALSRLHQRPHYVLAEGLLIAAIALYFQATKSKRLWLGWIAAICAALSAFTVPHAVLPFLAIVGFDCLIITFTERKGLLKAIAILFWVVPTVATILFMRAVALSDPVWLTYKDWEVNFWNKDWLFVYHYYVSFLPLLPFALWGGLESVSETEAGRDAVVCLGHSSHRFIAGF